MMWLIEYDDGFATAIDKVQGNTVLEAKRNLIAKVGAIDIKFRKVVKV